MPLTTIMMSSSPPQPNDIDTDADNININSDHSILDKSGNDNVDSTNKNNDNNNNNNDDDDYKGATLFGLEPKSSSSSSNRNQDGNDPPQLFDNTFGMQYTSIVIFILSCYVTVMLFFGDANDVV